MSAHILGHAVQHAFKESKSMHKVGVGKSPLVAFVAGFLFGPFGLGLYLRSWADCFIPLTLMIVGSIFSAGIGLPVLWCLCGAWGWVRVSNSNKAAEEELAAEAASPRVIHAELVEPAPETALSSRLAYQRA